MKKLNRNELILVSVCSAMIIFYGYYNLFLSPVLGKMSTISDSISKNNDTVKHINVVKNLNKVQKDKLTKLQVQYDEAAKALPKSERNPEVTYDIKNLADVNKVTINSISIGTGVEYKQQNTAVQNKTADNSKNNNINGRLMNLPVTININGDYLDMMDFVAAIEKDKRIAEVGTINFVTSNSGVIQGSVGVSYYYLDVNNKDVKYDFNNGAYSKDNLFK